MATNIPPHNLREVAAGVVWSLEQPGGHRRGAARRADGADQGPGLPDRRADRRQRRHRGRLPHRPRLDPDARGRRHRGGRQGPHHPGRHRAALPGQPGQPGRVDRRSCTRTAKIAGIADIADESSDRIGMRIVITLKRDAVAKVVLANLYKHTQLQTTLRRQHAGHRRRGAAHPAAGPDDQLLRRAPDRGHRPAHPVPAATRPRSGPTSCAAWSRRWTCSTRSSR